jgi:hypothetical protein
MDVRLKIAEMKFMRHAAGNILLDHKRNEDNLKEFNINPVEKN